MLQNAYLLAKIGADTAENERNFAKNWQLPYGSTTHADEDKDPRDLFRDPTLRTAGSRPEEETLGSRSPTDILPELANSMKAKFCKR